MDRNERQVWRDLIWHNMTLCLSSGTNYFRWDLFLILFDQTSNYRIKRNSIELQNIWSNNSLLNIFDENSKIKLIIKSLHSINEYFLKWTQLLESLRNCWTVFETFVRLDNSMATPNGKNKYLVLTQRKATKECFSRFVSILNHNFLNNNKLMDELNTLCT